MQLRTKRQSRWAVFFAAAAVLICLVLPTMLTAQSGSGKKVDPEVAAMIAQLQKIQRGKNVFRFNTFGDQAFWTDGLGLDQLVAAVSPNTALALGLKIDADALTDAGVNIASLDLNSPATTQAALQLNAVVGLKLTSDGKVGITCALCHSTVDNSVTYGVGNRLDGVPNRTLQVGTIIANLPRLQPLADFLHTDVATVRTVTNSWPAGTFDASLKFDGKAFRPDGKPASVLIPPAFGLRNRGLMTWTGWSAGFMQWNTNVAINEMGGCGKFDDDRLDDAAQFPLAAEHHLGHVNCTPDQVSGVIDDLMAYEETLDPPAPAAGSFDPILAEQGRKLFNGAAGCANCHNPGVGYTMTGYNLIKTTDPSFALLGVDTFQADRSPEHGYVVMRLGGLSTHSERLMHDGSMTMDNLLDKHGSAQALSPDQKKALLEFLKSL